MALEVTKYDIIYGKLLSLNFNKEHAKELAKTLYQISKNLNINVSELLKYVTPDGVRFENEIYTQLNKRRTNSSQLGFLDQNNLPSNISQQIPVYNNSIVASGNIGLLEFSISGRPSSIVATGNIGLLEFSISSRPSNNVLLLEVGIGNIGLLEFSISSKPSLIEL
jgi:hypothetical protein